MLHLLAAHLTLVTIAQAGAGDAAFWPTFVSTALMPFAYLAGLLRSHVTRVQPRAAGRHRRAARLARPRGRGLRRRPAAAQRDLHDGAQSRLVALALMLRSARLRPTSTRPRRACSTARWMELPTSLEEAGQPGARHPSRQCSPSASWRPALASPLAGRAQSPSRSTRRAATACPAGQAAPPTSSPPSAGQHPPSTRAPARHGDAHPRPGRVTVEVANNDVGGAVLDGGSGLRRLRPARGTGAGAPRTRQPTTGRGCARRSRCVASAVTGLPCSPEWRPHRRPPLISVTTSEVRPDHLRRPAPEGEPPPAALAPRHALRARAGASRRFPSCCRRSTSSSCRRCSRRLGGGSASRRALTSTRPPMARARIPSSVPSSQTWTPSSWRSPARPTPPDCRSSASAAAPRRSTWRAAAASCQRLQAFADGFDDHRQAGARLGHHARRAGRSRSAAHPVLGRGPCESFVPPPGHRPARRWAAHRRMGSRTAPSRASRRRRIWKRLMLGVQMTGGDARRGRRRGAAVHRSSSTRRATAAAPWSEPCAASASSCDGRRRRPQRARAHARALRPA